MQNNSVLYCNWFSYHLTVGYSTTVRVHNRLRRQPRVDVRSPLIGVIDKELLGEVNLLVEAVSLSPELSVNRQRQRFIVTDVSNDSKR